MPVSIVKVSSLTLGTVVKQVFQAASTGNNEGAGYTKIQI